MSIISGINTLLLLDDHRTESDTSIGILNTKLISSCSQVIILFNISPCSFVKLQFQINIL